MSIPLAERSLTSLQALAESNFKGLSFCQNMSVVKK